MTEKDLRDYRANVKQQNTEDIRNALRNLGGWSTTTKIWNYLDKETKRLNAENNKTIQKRYGPEEFRPNKTVRLVNEIKKNLKTTMSIKTIQRHVKNDPFIERRGRKYRLVPQAILDHRNFPSFVGDMLLSQLMSKHYPKSDSFEKNLKQLVEMFGIYVVYCFSICAKPIDDDYLKTRLTGLQKDQISQNWMTSTINPSNMIEYFLAAIRNQEYGQPDINSKSSTDEFVFSRLESYNYYALKRKDSRYELNSRQIELLNITLEKLYPNFYQYLAREQVFPLNENPMSDLIRDGENDKPAG